MWMKFPFVFSGGKVEKKENRLAARHVDLIGKKPPNFKGVLPEGRFLRDMVIREQFGFKEALN